MATRSQIPAIKVLSLLRDAREHGLTAAEIEDMTGVGHGAVSGKLSSMHRAGSISRLSRTKRPDGSMRYVYVLPEYVNGRRTQPQGRQQQQLSTPRIVSDEPLNLGAIVRNQRGEIAVRVLGESHARSGYHAWAGMDEQYGQWFSWAGLLAGGSPTLLFDGIRVL